MRLSDLFGVGDLVRGQRKHRLGVPGAERPGARNVRQQRNIGAAGRDGAVDQQHVFQPRLLDVVV